MTKKNLLGRKIIAVSDKRRITIPKNFYSQLVIRKAVPGHEDFSDLISAELSEEGLEGEKFAKAFFARKAKLETSLQAMLDDARRAANDEGEYFTMEEIFGGD